MIQTVPTCLHESCHTFIRIFEDVVFSLLVQDTVSNILCLFISKNTQSDDKSDNTSIVVMRKFFLYLLFIVCVVYLSTCDASCSESEKQDCRQDAIQNEGEWVRCKMCACDDFGDISGDGGESACSGFPKRYYKCYVKATSNSWSCKVKMKTDWLVAFIIVSVVGACVICSLCVVALQESTCKR